MDPMVVERKPETAVHFKCWNCLVPAVFCYCERTVQSMLLRIRNPLQTQ
jgi:hypothetical protein